MFGIRWYDGQDNVLTGEWRTVLNLARVFETAKIHYTVCLVGCMPVDKPHNGYYYWVTELFPDGKKITD